MDMNFNPSHFRTRTIVFFLSVCRIFQTFRPLRTYFTKAFSLDFNGSLSRWRYMTDANASRCNNMHHARGKLFASPTWCVFRKRTTTTWEIPASHRR